MQERRSTLLPRRTAQGRPSILRSENPLVNEAFERRAPPRTLAGATILQIVPALREEPTARAGIDIARMLLQVGARALVAAEAGPLVNELTGTGAEWVSLATDTLNPFRLHGAAGAIEQLVGTERIDILHAHGASAAWSARRAATRSAVWFVTTLPDVPESSVLGAYYAGAAAQSDRIIAPSVFAAQTFMQRHRLRSEQITVIPHSIDTAAFDPMAVPPGRVSALCQAWRISSAERVVLVPGRLAPWNGQMLVPDILRILVDGGLRDVIFVMVGENRTHRRYAQAVLKRAQAHGVAGLIRMTGHFSDLTSAFAVADVVLVPMMQAPVLGRLVAQAQAMARPVVTSDVGALPEHVVVPPQLPEDVRTGWVAKVGDADDFARALALALALDPKAYQAISARARQFAEYMFSPESVAAATRGVYTSLLTRDL
jgi:glycosyltransferase involved in cell wall biosynthesis